jgi:hypothetical protein
VTIASVLAVCLLSIASRRSDARDRVAVGIGLAGAISAVALVLLLAWAAIRRRIGLNRLRSRPALSDDEFIERLPRSGLLDREAVAHAVRVARALAVEHLADFGGDRIRPTDRLANDLRILDAGPWIVEDFAYRLAEGLDIDENRVDRALGSRPLTTFGDLVLAVAEASDRTTNRRDPPGAPAPDA